MHITQYRINNPWLRILQHLIFWMLSFYVFLYLFKLGNKPQEIDYIYTALFHLSILPPVYINLLLLLPLLKKRNNWAWYPPLVLFIIAVFSWINLGFFSKWSNTVLPDYFFIAYLSLLQVAMVFIVYVIITSLLKLSKSWFLVGEMQKKLLEAGKLKLQHEKELIELEARALRAQMNPHFIFNALNSIQELYTIGDKKTANEQMANFATLTRKILDVSGKQKRRNSRNGSATKSSFSRNGK